MRGEGARRADEGLSLEAAKTAKDLPPTERWSCFGGGFLAVFAARNNTRQLCRASFSGSHLVRRDRQDPGEMREILVGREDRKSLRDATAQIRKSVFEP